MKICYSAKNFENRNQNERSCVIVVLEKLWSQR